MFEGLIVDLLNNYLGKYIQNLDRDNLRLGIFNGNAELCNLQLRPEALFELDLPIEVKAGYVGRICLEIPWTSLFSSPVLCTLDDVYILAGPLTDRPYDATREQALDNARKRKRLELLEQGTTPATDNANSQNQSFTQKLTTTIINNIQVTIQRVHIRYEDSVSREKVSSSSSSGSDHASSSSSSSFGCGLMLKEVSLQTTNSHWSPQHIDATATVVHKLLQIHSFSVYWNPYLPEQALVRNKLHTSAWRSQLKTSISTHRIGEEDFEFFLRPISTSANLILNKDEQNQIPLIVANVVMEELEILFSRQQFLSVLSIYELFRMMAVNQRYRKYKKTLEVKGHYKEWWIYAKTAICEEFIRPYSWQRIQQHRKKYRQYKDLYKKYLLRRDEKLKNELSNLEMNLDEANITIAREHAKLEIASESPARVKKQKPAKSWFSWWWSNPADEGGSDEEEEVIISPDASSAVLNLPQWMNRLQPEEHQQLFKSIGYDQDGMFQHSSEFISHKVVFNLQSCSGSLVNYGKEVLKVSLTQLALNCDNRPEADGFRVSAKTENFVVEGVSVEHELVPIITSLISVYAPSAVTQGVFSLEFDKNPPHVEADFAAKLNIQPVEVVYDEHAVTEIVAFFQVPHITTKDVKAIAQAGFDHFAQISRAGLQYAIEQHKTLHLSVNMRSPYVVIPEYGTLHRGGNVIILDFGKLKIESELQPKHVHLEECTMSEIESRLYDKFSVTVTEVKMLLADSGEDWHTAQTKPESEFHVLPNFGLQLSFFNTVKSEFKQLPKHKLEWKLSTLKINLSDEKLQMLGDFCKHIPMPHSNSMMGLDDSVDGHIEPTIPIMDEKEVQLPPTFKELVVLRRVVHHNSVLKPSDLRRINSQHSYIPTPESDLGGSALDGSDDEAEDWTKNLDVKAVDETSSTSNLITVYARFTIAEIVLQVSKVEDKIETPYLMLRVDRVCFDSAITTYGVVMQARLGGIQLVDKIHLGSSGEYLELLGFKTETDLMSLVYRKVSADCPDFNAMYHGLVQGIVIKLSSLRVTFNREAVLFLNAFVQGLLQSIQGNLHSTLRKSNSTILSGPANCDPYQPEMPSFIDRLTQPNDGPTTMTKLHLVIKLNDLGVLLCDRDSELIDVSIKDMEGRLVMKRSCTVIQARLRDFSVDDLTESSLYPRILSLDDDNAFDLKRVTYHRMQTKTGLDQQTKSVDGSLRLRVGRIQGVFVYKLIREIQNFLQPFANPEIIESYKVAAQHAVYNKIQDMHDQGTRISVLLDVHAPTVFIPQNPESSNVIVVKLGYLRVKNSFEESDVGQGVIQRWDHLFLSLEAVQIMRGKLNLNGNIEPVHTLVEPMNLSLDLKRALPPHRIDTHYDLSGRLKNVRMQLTAMDLRVLLSVLRDNLLEEFSSKTEPLDMADFGLPMSRSGGDVMRRSSIDTTTPVVEIEEPLLFAPEVMELVQTTKFSFDMEGATVLLYTEDDDPLAPSSPFHGEGDELASFAIDGVTFSGTVDSNGLVEVRLRLSQLSMTDIRPLSNLAVKKLIRSGLSDARGYSSCPTPVVDIAYHRNPEGNRQIDFNLDTIRINVCIQYLLTIFDFFAEPLSEFSRNSSPSATPLKKPAQKTSSSYGELPVPPPPPVTETVLPPVSEALTVRARFKQLEVVLFADPTDKHSRVLVLKENASLDYSCLQERKSVNAKIRQLQVISCIYGKTAQTTSIELYPCDIELKCSKESSEKELKVNLNVTEVNLYISPATVHIFLDVVDIWRQSAERRKNMENESEKMNSGLRSDLWNVRAISAEPWLNATEDENHECCKRIQFSEGPPVETLNIEVKKVNLVFEIQEQKYYVPRLCIKTALSAEVFDWSKQVYGKVELPVEVLYYNDKLCVWEPLVEPVMEKEGTYRQWGVTVKLVKAESHPMSCTTVDLKLDKQDSADGQIHEFWARHRARSEAESSESETDSETEMTVIKPKLSRAAPLSSHSSYDSMSHHSSIQGESDSETEILSSINTQLHSLLSSDSSDGAGDLEDGDTFEAVERPVFLTARGPVSVIPGSKDYDEVDGGVESSLTESKGLCTYVVINSQDQLLLNVNPASMDIITEIYEMLEKRGSSSVKQSVHDLPPFEVFNQLGIGVNMSVSSDQKVYEDAIHDVTLDSPCEKTKQMFIDELDGVKLVDVDEDEIDGLMNLSKAIRELTTQLIGISVRCSPTGSEDDEDNLNDGRRIGKEKMHVKVDGFNELCNISFKKASRQLIRLSPTQNDIEYCLICDVDIHHSRKVITLRSPLLMHNHLTIPVQVFCDADELQKQKIDVNASSRDDHQFVQISCLDPDGSFALPLHIAYHCKLYVAPANMLYEKTSDAIWWQDFGSIKESHKFFSCQPQTPNNNVFYFKVQLEEDVTAKRPSSIPRPLLNGTLHLSPSIVLHNLLPLNIHYSLEGSALSQLGPGDNIPLFTADLARNPKLQLQIINYLSVDWTGSMELNSDLEEFKAINMEPDSNVEGQNKQMSLSIHMNQRLAMDLYVYSPYWIINKTSLPIQIRGSRSEAVYENNDSLDPLLFRFKKHRRKKAKLRVYNSKWTRSFSLDTIGSSGVVICYDKERNRRYQFLLQIELSKLKLTKIVTVMPYFLVVNNTPFHLRYMEDNEQADLWMDFTPNECCPFWPATESPKMYIRFEESNVCSQHFPVDRPHKTVLRMEKGTALCVDVTVTEISIVVRVLPYQPGDIPVRVDNLCEDVFLKLHQKKQSQVTLLSPNQSVLYTWDDPAAERTLMWNVYNRRKPSYPAFINKDGSGAVQLSILTVRRSSVMWSSSRRSIYDDRKIKNERSDTIQYDSSSDDDSDGEAGPKHVYLRQNTRTDKVIVYWVSYLDGIQRVLLLTQDERIAKRAIKMNEAEMATSAIFLSMNGVGISLMNDLREEVAYISLSSGATVWEVEIKSRWKLLSIEIASWLEQEWLKDEFGQILLEDIVEADLGKMEMIKPYVGKLRRTFNPGLWMQLKQSEHNTYFQMRIHWIQIDNQLSDAIFPTIMNPYRIPAYIIKKSGPKPCVELTVARRQIPEVNLDTYKYVKLLMQEFCINLDKGFMMSIYDLFISRQTPKPESYLLGRDVNKATMSLADKVRVHDSSRATCSVYEFLHLSPIKMHVSLSLDGRAHLSTSSSVDNSNASVTSDIVDFFLNSVGAKLIDVKDVELRMAYFEREGVMLNFQQLTHQVLSHYKTQSLQQAYVLLLGLDVLGNPYGLVKDFTQGLGDFFYEPFLGVIQEPDKYAENLVQGIRSLLGHTVGGLALSMSSFARSLGKTLAYLSFDDEYKQMRVRRLQQQPSRLPQSLCQAGSSFAMGVCLGLSGVILHPLRGTKEEGVEGFFKGIGKGLMGLITKPTGGAVDMVSMAFDGLRRSAEMGEDVVHRMRLPRYIHPLGLRPFSTYQSVGMKILHTVMKTGNQDSDIYWAHAALTREEKSDVVLVTDRRVFLLKKCKSWGEWSVEWDVLLSSLTDLPLVLDGKLILRLRKNDLETSWKVREDKELSSTDEELLNWIQKRISKAMKL